MLISYECYIFAYNSVGVSLAVNPLSGSAKANVLGLTLSFGSSEKSGGSQGFTPDVIYKDSFT